MKSKFLSVFLLLVYLFSIPGAGVNAQPIRQTALPAGGPSMEITTRNLTALVDDFVANNMAITRTPGMVVTVVHQGHVVLSRGYGYADLEAGIPMTPETTLRAGSVSKPVTSAVVLKLAAEGLIDLNAPASDSYTSWEHALLGYLLEKVSQQPFDQVMAETLFEPLGMENTTFTQPLPEPIVARLAQGYLYKNGEFQKVPLDLVNLAPGIAMVTTAQDMGRFMLALLDEGEFAGQQVLPVEAIQGLLTRQEALYPYSRARTYGFSEIDFDHRAALYHDGNGIGFGSRMVLVPEYEFGFFISVNHRPLGYDASPTPAYRFLRQLSAALMEQFIPATFSQPMKLEPLPGAAERAANYTGQFALASTPQHDFFKIGALLDCVDVSDNHDGTLSIGSGRYVEVEPLVFRNLVDASSFAIFRENAQGKAEYLTFGGTNSYRRVPWFESLNFTLGLVAIFLIVFLSFALLWPFTHRGHCSTWLLSLLNLGFLLGFGWMLWRADLILFFKNIPAGTQVLLGLPWLSAVISLSQPLFLVRLWKQRSALWPRLHYTLTVVTALVFIWFAWNWKLFLM